ncbi:hypothetical protein BRO54_1425 [Geobacillus proteiniphilus]|uniref:Uncharacterized protein n=1 Tax=Geobacillus proteiniphilus TaxID=860353 RepID=A0A1Q5T395_9BACL|nr:hypothetical protein BRO54_1425 [Geobacillus proteiniphilus]
MCLAKGQGRLAIMAVAVSIDSCRVRLLTISFFAQAVGRPCTDC